MAGIDNNTLLYLRGDSFTDLSPEPKTIKNNGVTIHSSGKFGSALNFVTANNQYISISNTNNIFAFGTNDFTVDFWINFTSFFDNQAIFTPMGDTAWVSKTGSWHLICDEAGLVAFDYYKGTTIADKATIVTKKLNLNCWYHVALVRNNNVVTLYIDGVSQGSLSVTTSFIGQSKAFLGKHDGANNICTNGKIDEFRISNIARYTTNFTPPTQQYNSINITNQTSTNIDFSIIKLGQETINKVEVLVNNVVSETYTDSYDNISYEIDKELVVIGVNKIKIKVTYDEDYTEDEVLTHTVTIDQLPTTTSLKQVVDTVELIAYTNKIEYDTLKTTLISKNVEVSEEDKMSSLIDKVDMLGAYDNPILWLYKDGDECADVTGGFIGGKYSDVAGTYSGTVTNINNRIELRRNAGSNIWACSINNLIDVTNYSKLIFIADIILDSTGNSPFIIGKNRFSEKSYSASYVNNISANLKTIEIDIKNITGTNYIYFGTYLGAVNVYKIWLEK